MQDVFASKETSYDDMNVLQFATRFDLDQHIVFIGVSYTRNMYRCFCDLLTNGGSAHVDARWPEDRRNGPFPGGLAVACNNQNANAHFDNR